MVEGGPREERSARRALHSFSSVSDDHVGNYYSRTLWSILRRKCRTNPGDHYSTGNVVASIAGHVHWNSWHCTDDIAFITLQSLTESFCTPGAPSETWGTLELGDTLRFSTVGRQPMHLEVPLRQQGNRWLRGNLRLRSRQKAYRAPSLYDQWSYTPISAVLVDLDGVLWKGDTPIEGGVEAIEILQNHHIPVLFLTNNALLTREDYAKKLHAMGVFCTRDDILTAGYAAAHWVRKNSRGAAFSFSAAALREEFRSMVIEEDERRLRGSGHG